MWSSEVRMESGGDLVTPPTATTGEHSDMCTGNGHFVQEKDEGVF